MELLKSYPIRIKSWLEQVPAEQENKFYVAKEYWLTFFKKNYIGYTAIERAMAVYKDIDILIKDRIKNGIHPIPCIKRMCQSECCCCCHITVTPSEKKIITTYSGNDIDEIIPCKFLNKNNYCCSIYSIRPIACRCFFVTGQETNKCFSNNKPLVMPQVDAAGVAWFEYDTENSLEEENENC